MDDAREGIHRVQQLLRRFQRELADVQTEMGSEMEIGRFATFADYFFDGLIVDWVVQSKINASLDTTRQQLAKVERLSTCCSKGGKEPGNAWRRLALCGARK